MRQIPSLALTALLLAPTGGAQCDAFELPHPTADAEPDRGWLLAPSGDRVLVASPNEDVPFVNAGVARIYVREGAAPPSVSVTEGGAGGWMLGVAHTADLADPNAFLADCHTGAFVDGTWPSPAARASAGRSARATALNAPSIM